MDDIYYLVQYGNTSHRYYTCEQAVLVFGRAQRLAKSKATLSPCLLLKKCLMTKNCGGKYKIHATVLLSHNFMEEDKNETC